MLDILIVEDEYRIRNGLQSLITKLNMQCRVIGEAENGYEGLLMIHDLQPDVVITDVKMPKMDGLQMLETARAQEVKAKFIILSGYADFKYAQKAIQLGVFDYLLKPISIGKVKELLQVLVADEAKELDSQDEISACHQVIRSIVSDIEKHYNQRLGLENFADRYRLTPEYISGLFTKEMGMTFSEYLKKVRMDKAIVLLQQSDFKIYEIACRVGYSDPKYFSKIFKEYTGYSAKQYVMKSQLGLEIK